MKLADLEASFVGQLSEDGRQYRKVPTLAEAQGVMFICPKCGGHSILCWFKDRGVPDTQDPKPGRWIPSGSGLADLTFVGPGAASVLLTGGCGWHGFVKDGNAE